MRSPATTSALFNTVKTARLGWQRNSIDHGRHCLRVGYRFASSNSSDPQDSTENASTTAHPSSLEAQSIQTAPVPTPAVERPERGRRAKTASAPPIESVDWPEDLEVLSTGPYDSEPDPSDASALPPPHIFDEVLNNFLITLHPQTQNRATYATAQGPAVEPTLALYCPIEGGDYIIDATVKELARRTGAELLVIDGVQLAAGEWGEFGKGTRRYVFCTEKVFTTSSSCQHDSITFKSVAFPCFIRGITSSYEYDGRRRRWSTRRSISKFHDHDSDVPLVFPWHRRNYCQSPHCSAEQGEDFFRCAGEHAVQRWRKEPSPTQDCLHTRLSYFGTFILDVVSPSAERGTSTKTRSNSFPFLTHH